IYQIESRETAAFTYTLRADGDATIKAYKIPVRLTYQDLQGNTFDKNDTIGVVVDAAPELGVYLQSSTLSVPEQKGKVVLQVVNQGLLDVRFLSIRLTGVQGGALLSPSEQYLGDTDADDFETAEFEVLPANVSEVRLAYTIKGQDSTNRPVEISGERSVPLYSVEEAQTLGLLPKDRTGYYIIAAIVLLALIIYAVIKRRR
ncbi:hypothetical protein HY642_04035, partial [Candidatus Woesearchaeota archaeon]|nr:hypothetical protein [Candidatus Woesearchaeota archaeon]